MKRRQWWSLALLSTALTILAAWQIREPGYMDAEYYYATGIEIAEGRGFSEPFLWNYLDDPEGLPHPSHRYWMPLTSLFVALPVWIFGSSFRAAQGASVLLTLLLPLLTARLAGWMGLAGRRAFLCGLLALFPGYFLAFNLTTDSFALYALLGAAGLWALAAAAQSPGWSGWLAAGLLIGLAHLTRADGLLLLIPALFALSHSKRSAWRAGLLLAAGYALVMMPWFLRNMLVGGSPLPAGASRAIWQLSYNELFSYPAEKLSAQRWLQAGWAQHFSVRLQALGLILASLLGVNGLVYLWAPVLLGIRKHRTQLLVRLWLIYLLMLGLVMAFVFPFAGPRGGFFHSSAALMPLLWIMALEGIAPLIRSLGRKRGWNLAHAEGAFSAGLVALAALLTGYLYWGRVVGPNPAQARWNTGSGNYRQVEALLEGLPAGRAAVNNPPGFYLQTGVEAIVIPDGDENTLRQALLDFEVDWLVLESNHPAGLKALYARQGLTSWTRQIAVLPGADGAPIYLLETINGEAQDQSP